MLAGTAILVIAYAAKRVMGVISNRKVKNI